MAQFTLTLETTKLWLTKCKLNFGYKYIRLVGDRKCYLQECRMKECIRNSQVSILYINLYIYHVMWGRLYDFGVQIEFNASYNI